MNLVFAKPDKRNKIVIKMNTNLLDKFSRSMIDEALRSPLRSQLSAGILKNKRMICKPRCNMDRTSYHGHLCGSIHAEAHALINYFGKNLQYDKCKKIWCLKRTIIKQLDVIVIRVNKQEEFVSSRPCYNCLTMMKSIGIRNVYYTTGIKNELICESVKNMVSIHLSVVARRSQADPTNCCESLLMNNLPKYIIEKNLMYFIKYNFQPLFPHLEFNFNNNNQIKMVTFYNKNMEIIVTSIII